MRPGEPILLVCHGFPPVRGIGGRRWVKFAKELARRGHPVHVIRNAATPATLTSLWAGDARHPLIIHHPLPQRYPSVMTKRPLRGTFEKLAYHAWLRLLPLFIRGNFHDTAAFWRRQLVAEGDRLIREHGIRQVIVTGAPFHLMAFATAWKTRFPHVRLVTDFRDEWTWGGHYGFTSLSQRRQREEKDLEALVIRNSDVVITPHQAIVEHLAARYGNELQRVVRIPHAVDPDDLPAPSPPPADGKFRMIYAGSLYRSDEADRYFRSLLDAFEATRAKHPDRFARVQLDLYITSQGVADLRKRVEERGLSGHIHFHAPLPPKEILRRIGQADLVPLFLSSDKKDAVVTKLHELFLLRRPVLHIGEPGAVGRMIAGHGLGASLRLDELAVELPKILGGERVIAVDLAADHGAFLLGPVTDRLVREALQADRPA